MATAVEKSSPHERGWWLPVSAGLPAWAMSVVFHAGLLIALGLFLEAVPRGLPQEETSREVGITLKRYDPNGKVEFDSPDDSPVATEATQMAAVPTPREMVGPDSPVDISTALPQGRELTGIGAMEPGQLGGGAALLEGSRPNTVAAGGKARLKVFGTESEGMKFIFVFDRSGSMEGAALRAAKRELLEALDQLGPTHQFGIVFYNQEPQVFQPAPGQPGRLVFGNDASKRIAHQFVGGIMADGATEHVRALETALAMQPDVVFFLTDADWTGSTEFPYARIKARNRNDATINCIMFGTGPDLSRNSFMQSIAGQNQGQYAYIDVTQIGPAP